MPLLFRLLLVAAASLTVSSGEAQTACEAYNPSMCQKSFTCSDQFNVQYLFYLHNESNVIDRVTKS